ncbi:MAG TPA: non-ribosomal peptide synthetase [Acidobacteriaceae bacterium]
MGLTSHTVQRAPSEAVVAKAGAGWKQDREIGSGMQLKKAGRAGHEERARAAIQEKVQRIWARALERDHVDADSDFYFHGGDHFLAPVMMKHLSEELGMDLTVRDLEQARTIAKMTDLVYFEQTRIDRSTVVPLRNVHGVKPPLFMVHGVGGNVLGFYALARQLDEDQPVYGIQAQALLPQREVKLRLEEMAAQYVADMREIWPDGPYHLLGFSFGGLVAYEIARQLKAAGLEVGLLGMLDTRQPQEMRGVPVQGPLHRRMYLRARLLYLRTYRRNGRVKYLWRRLMERAQRANYMYAAKTGQSLVTNAARNVREINYAAGISYVVQPYAGKVTLFKAEPVAEEIPLPEDLNWGSAADDVVIRNLPGDHGRILLEPGLSALAAGLTAELDAPEAGAGRVEMEF